MAAFDKPRLLAGYKAAADLSAKQYHYVDATADDEVNLAGGATGELGQGWLMNKPIAGINAEVAGFGGGCMVKLEGTVVRNGEIMANANSKGVAAATAGDIVSAIAKVSGVTGDVIPAQAVLYRKHA